MEFFWGERRLTELQAESQCVLLWWKYDHFCKATFDPHPEGSHTVCVITLLP